MVTFDDDSAINCTVQMWGALACFPANEKSSIPDYLTPEKNLHYYQTSLTIAILIACLMKTQETSPQRRSSQTEQRFPGLGNGVLQDILWTAKIVRS